MNRSMLKSAELAKIIADGLADKKGSDITIYDVRTHSTITDFHVPVAIPKVLKPVKKEFFLQFTELSVLFFA